MSRAHMYCDRHWILADKHTYQSMESKLNSPHMQCYHLSYMMHSILCLCLRMVKRRSFNFKLMTNQLIKSDLQQIKLLSFRFMPMKESNLHLHVLAIKALFWVQSRPHSALGSAHSALVKHQWPVATRGASFSISPISVKSLSRENLKTSSFLIASKSAS